MPGYVDTPTRTFTAGAALGADLRVVLSSGKLALAGINDVELGTMEAAVFADLDLASVRLNTARGTSRFIAAAAIAVGADVYGAASGKVNDVGGGAYIGVALSAAAGDGEVIEVLRLPAPGGNITHHTAGATLTRAQRNSVHTNLGAGAAIALALPQDAVAGDRFVFAVMAAQELRVDPGAAGAIYIGGAKQNDDAYITADDEAESVTLVADGNGDWVAVSPVGTWSVV